MIKISKELISSVSNTAKINQRLRQHYNFHHNYQETLQRLLNACEPESYFRPHNHSDSNILEILLLVRGAILIVIFDDDGKIIDHLELSEQSGHFGAEILAHEWHCTIALEPGSVMYEIKQGPFNEKTPKVFAPWSTPENSVDAQYFNENIRKELGY